MSGDRNSIKGTWVFQLPPKKDSGFSSLANGSFRLNLWPPRWSIKSQSFLDEKGGQETSSGIFKVCIVSAAFSLSALNVPKELCQAAQNLSGFWKWSGRVRIPCTIIDTVYYISWESCDIVSSLLLSTLETETAKHTMTWTDGPMVSAQFWPPVFQNERPLPVSQWFVCG